MKIKKHVPAYGLPKNWHSSMVVDWAKHVMLEAIGKQAFRKFTGEKS